MPRWARGYLMLLLLLAASPGVVAPEVARAHDPSAWGGIYRTRDHGATWLLANEGRFVTAALALPLSPADPTHLLLATDSGLLRPTNGGRDWDVAGPAVLVGPVYAVAFDADGRRALASTGSELFVREVARDAAPTGGRVGERAWRPVATPPGGVPARAIVPGPVAGRVYLAGWDGLFRSDDWGASWSAADGLPPGPVETIVAAGGPRETLLAIVAGGIWAAAGGADAWHPRDNGLPSGRVDTVALDPARPDRLWAAGLDRLFRSDDGGVSWHAVGNPLNERRTTIRGIAADADARSIVLTADRGLYRSADGGQGWELQVDNLPIHLEARPLVRDPRDPATLYAGFSITPYDAIWRSGADGRPGLARLDGMDLAGGAAFVALLGLAAGWALRRLRRYYGPVPASDGGSPSPSGSPTSGTDAADAARAGSPGRLSTAPAPAPAPAERSAR